MLRMGKKLRALRQKISLRLAGILVLGFFLVSVATGFVYALVSTWEDEGSPPLSCGSLPTNSPHSYIQYSIKDQAAEPYFHGAVNEVWLN